MPLTDPDYAEEPSRAICTECGKECDVLPQVEHEGVGVMARTYGYFISDCCRVEVREHTPEELAS